jgi:hypothetical protein
VVAGGEPVESALASSVASIGARGMLAVARRGIDHGGLTKRRPGWCARTFWTIAVIDGCYEGVSPVAARMSRKRRGAGRGGRRVGTAVHLPAVRQADEHL